MASLLWRLEVAPGAGWSLAPRNRGTLPGVEALYVGDSCSSEFRATMGPVRNTPQGELSLSRLLAMLFSPLAMRNMLEEVPVTPDRVEIARAHYRNSLFLFEHIERHITRSAVLIAACFFLQGLLSVVIRHGIFFVVLSVLILIATVHVAWLGIYRQILNDRINRYARIAGLERPPTRDPVEQFPRSESDGTAPQARGDGRRPTKPRENGPPPR